MYSKEIEEVIDAALLVVIMTDNVRNALRSRAEAEGEDADEVSMVAESRLRKQSSQSAQAELVEDETYRKPLLEPGHNLIVPENVMKKVLKIMEGYNKKAEKWGYEVLRFHSFTHTIEGRFRPKTDAEDSKAGFMAEMKEAYKNGDLGEEWKKILKLCDRMDLWE